MPNIKSAEKRLKQSEKRRARNRAYKSQMRGLMKKANKALESGDAAQAKTLVKDACRKLDKVAQKGVIHASQASRKKSRLMLKLNKMSS
jgi:small subunit ribosomal protein S20